LIKIAIVVIENCLTTTIHGMQDILSIANMCSMQMHPTATESLFSTELVSSDGMPRRSFNGVEFTPASAIADIDDVDIIFIPPITINVESVLSDNLDIIQWIKKHHDAGVLLSSVCTGAFFLAEGGLLDGKSATTNQSYAVAFSHRYPKVNLQATKILTVDDNILCAGSTFSFMELAIHIIERYCGHDIAVQCSKILLIDKNRESQAPFMIFDGQKRHGDNTIVEIQDWLEKHAREPLSIDDLSETFNMSSRNMTRRFKNATGDSPSVYIQRLRIESAKHFLEESRKSFDEITYTVGYEDSRSFSRLFKKYTGLTPTNYRKKYQ